VRYKLPLFRLYECCLTNKVYIEMNTCDHSDINQSGSIDENKYALNEVVAYGIDDYFIEIIKRIVIENPLIKPMDIHKVFIKFKNVFYLHFLNILRIIIKNVNGNNYFC
jgi:hypothetical protein